jgi:dynein heavy chain
LETSVQKAKDNVEEIVKLISTWSKTPLFARKEDKYDTLLNLDDRQDRLEKRYGCIEETGTKIHELIKVWFFTESN